MRSVLLSAAAAVLLAVPAATQQAPGQPVELNVGDKAPDFALPGSDGKTHKLADYAGKAVVLAWFPAAFTGGWTAECKSLRASGNTIRQFDVAYFMVSVDPAETNARFAKEHEADFPILSDPGRSVAAAYGVLGQPSATRPNPTARRWTFYIGPDGKILHIDKAVSVSTAGEDLAARLAELKVKRK